MLWWDWDTKRKWSLLAGIIFASALPWIALGWFPSQLGAFAGGVAFLAIPQMVGWMLCVGLVTGSVPMHYGRRVYKDEEPAEFWTVCATYGALVALFVMFIIYVLIEAR